MRRVAIGLTGSLIARLAQHLTWGRMGRPGRAGDAPGALKVAVSTGLWISAGKLRTAAGINGMIIGRLCVSPLPDRGQGMESLARIGASRKTGG